MRDYTKFYINGAWVAPSGSDTLAVENPATLEQCATIAIGNEADVDTAVAAAKSAFETFSQTSVEERAALLDKIAEDTRLRKARQDGRLPTDEATLAIDPTSDKPVAVQ